jgi:adenosylhomocysteine nucleosidase
MNTFLRDSWFSGILNTLGFIRLGWRRDHQSRRFGLNVGRVPSPGIGAHASRGEGTPPTKRDVQICASAATGVMPRGADGPTSSFGKKVVVGVLVFWVLCVAVHLRAAEAVEILVQGAEKLEVEEIVAVLEHPQKIQMGPFSFWTGEIGGHRIAVQLTGQGLLNCTTSTIIGIEEFSPKLIVNQGTSGAQAPYLGLHDIIVGKRALDYGAFTSNARSKGEGSKPLTWQPVPQSLRDLATGRLVAFPKGFEGDAGALAVALRTRNSMGRVFAGVIGSAHEVNLEMDRVRWSHETFSMDVEEMESGHVAAIAHAYGIRYMAFRVVSDAPYDGVPFYALAARATGLFTVSFLQNLPVQ